MTTPHPSTSDGARTPLHVVLADDSGIFRQGLASLLTATGITVTASVASVEDLLAAVARDQPDIAIVDVRMPPTNTDEGIRAAAHLHRDHPAVGVLVLSTYVEARLVTRLLDAVPEGVGYLLKDRVDDVAALLGVMHRIAAGGIALYPEVVRSLSASGASISEEPSNSTERCVITPTRTRRLEAHLARPSSLSMHRN